MVYSSAHQYISIKIPRRTAIMAPEPETLTELNSILADNFDPDLSDAASSTPESTVNTKSERYGKVRSHIWGHNVKPASGEHYLLNSKGQKIWRCVHCPKKPSKDFLVAKGSSGPAGHLKRAHHIHTTVAPRIQKQTSNIITSMAAAAEHQQLRKRTRHNYENVEFDPRVFQYLFIR